MNKLSDRCLFGVEHREDFGSIRHSFFSHKNTSFIYFNGQINGIIQSFLGASIPPVCLKTISSIVRCITDYAY
jgi:hypothetical protein